MRIIRHTVLGLALLLIVCAANHAVAQISGLGVMGDSLSDEYAEETYGAYATNWVPQLVIFRGVNVGPTAAAAGQPSGTWGTPRRTGYEFNWALSGDTSGDLLADGQDTGLAGQVAAEGLTHAVLAIGANDFHPAQSAYFNIYNGFWSASQINNYVAQILTNIETALVTVSTTGVKLVVFNILDYGETPAVYNNFLYTNATKRDRVTAVIEKTNAGIAQLTQKYQVPLVDALRLQQTIFGPNTNLLQYLYLGNVAIHLQEGDTDPINNPNRLAAFVEDNAHPHTTIQGLFANMALEAFRLGYGTDIPLFSESEILAHAGLAYGGADTLESQIGPYSNYVILPVRPCVTSLQFTGGALQLTFTTASNQLYRVEATTSLVAPDWQPLTNNVPGTGGLVGVSDPDATNYSQRFYRVRQLP